MSVPVTPLEAIQKLRIRQEMDSLGNDGMALYLGAWEYDLDDWTDGAEGPQPPCLGDDLQPGVSFARCLLRSELGDHHAMLRSLRWIYIGEAETGTSAHMDPIATHGWMWMAAGRKEWR